MAVTVREMLSPGLNPWHWYNVSFPVGQNAPNRVDDVYLAQLLLAYLRPYVGVLQDTSLKLLRVDGSCGPITQSYIDAYQTHLQVRFVTYRADGVVDPGRRYQGDLSSRKGLMIWLLNYELHEKAPAAQKGIPTDTRTPLILQMALKNVI